MKKFLGVFLPAVGAGIGIGIGGIVFLSMENKTVGALLFTVGLYLICANGLNLYTGKVGYLVGEKASYLLFLLEVWIGNFVGTGLAALAIRCTRVAGIAEKAASICDVKLNDTPFSIILLSFFCGLLMFVAVDGYKKTQNPIILFICVSVFILAGFEHCIANMFYFSVSATWSGKAFLYLILMTLGNSLGGVTIPLLKLPLEKK